VTSDLKAAITAAYDQRWKEALDLAARAGDAGDTDAQAQLAVLANHREGASWQEVRSAINPDTLIATPAVQRISDAAMVGAARGYASPAMCAWLMERAANRLQPATVNDAVTGEQRQHEMRTALNCAFGPDDRDLILAVLQTRAARLSKAPVNCHEAPNIISYEPGQQFALHVDFVDPSNPNFANELALLGQRTVTIVTYLNEDFDGAETLFPALKLKFRGGVGDAVIFSNVRPDGSPDPNTVHAGLPPTRGRKWVLSQWLRNKPQPYN